MSAVHQMAKKAGGFALMMAVFLIVTLAAIGVYLLTISTGQLAAVSQDQQSGRAHQAARTGIEWAAYRVAKGASCAGVTQLLPALQQDLAGFWVRVNCTSAITETEGANPVEVFQITATGCNNATCPLAAPPGPTDVERQLQLTLTR